MEEAVYDAKRISYERQACNVFIYCICAATFSSRVGRPYGRKEIDYGPWPQNSSISGRPTSVTGFLPSSSPILSSFRRPSVRPSELTSAADEFISEDSMSLLYCSRLPNLSSCDNLNVVSWHLCGNVLACMTTWLAPLNSVRT